MRGRKKSCFLLLQNNFKMIRGPQVLKMEPPIEEASPLTSYYLPLVISPWPAFSLLLPYLPPHPVTLFIDPYSFTHSPCLILIFLPHLHSSSSITHYLFLLSLHSPSPHFLHSPLFNSVPLFVFTIILPLAISPFTFRSSPLTIISQETILVQSLTFQNPPTHHLSFYSTTTYW